jgi:hypothetical protein
VIPRTNPESSRVSLAGAVAVVLASCLPYLSTIRDYFTQDDFGVVMLFARKPWTTFPQWFTMPWTEDIWGYTPDEIRPFPALSYQITALWGAAAPEAHHLLNIAIHAGNAVLVLAIARTVAGLSPIAAAFAAVVFAILPVQAESVAWITGRVDSMPAFFYLATFLAYARWRMSGGTSTRAFLWTLVLFFLALFSKQNTITMVATLVLYDWLIAGRPLRPSWSWLRPYVPFALMTVGFLVLRYAVVGTVVREGTLNAEGFRFFVDLFGRHLRRVVLGRVAAPTWVDWSVWGGLTVAIGLAAVMPDAGNSRRRVARLALFFGPLWWVIGVAPTAVAGYESPRHVYLASVAWAMLLGLGFDVADRATSARTWRNAVRVCAVVVLAAYAVQLRVVVREWNTAAAISKKGVARVQREALATPPGSLLIVGAPLKSWEWSVPFNFQPPYTQTDLTQRVFIVSPWRLHCCRSLWADYTRRTLAAWAARGDHPPIVVLFASARTGAISRLTDREYPALRSLIPVLLTMESREAMDKALLDIVERLAGNGA